MRSTNIEYNIIVEFFFFFFNSIVGGRGIHHLHTSYLDTP